MIIVFGRFPSDLERSREVDRSGTKRAELTEAVVRKNLAW